MMKRFSIALILFLISTSFVQAEAGESLSLEQTLRMAYLNHPRMMEAREEIKAATGRWIQAEALPDPELGLEVGGFKKTTNEESGAAKRRHNLDSVEVRQPLDPPGTRFLRGRIGHDGVNIAKGDLTLVWAEVRKQVIELYARILAEEKAGEISTENLNATRQFFTRVQGRFQSGSALQSDVIRAKIEVSRAENDLLINQKNLKVSRGEMNLALGRLVDEVLVLNETLAYEPLQYQYEKIKSQALLLRADLKNESTRLSSAKKNLWSSVLTTFFPKMSIGIGRTTQDFDNDTSLLLQASYPLWGFNLGRVKEAKAEKDKQQVRLEALKRRVGLEVYKAFLEAELADKQVELQKRALEEANELLRQVTLQYEQGAVPFLTYLENIKTIKETRLAYFNALRNYKEKVAELERVIQATPAPEGLEK